MTRLFISKNAVDLPLLAAFCRERNIEFVAKSLIRFEAVAFASPELMEVIFFNSPRSAEFFLRQCKPTKEVKLACVGEGTASALRKFGLVADFVGQQSDTRILAQTFKEWCGSRKVLFPISNRSIRTISKIFPDNQKTELIVYRTIESETRIERSAIYVFSSPSNVEAFLKLNEIPRESLIIAWGPSTATALEKSGISSALSLQESNERSLIQLLQQAIS